VMLNFNSLAGNLSISLFIDLRQFSLTRRDFWEKIRSIPIEDLIFVDESGVNLALIKLYARALRGQRARGTRPQKRGKNVP
jgi:hypothetical protein